MNITVKALSNLPVPVPPLEVQGQLVELLKAADAAYEAAVSAAETRRRLAHEVVVDGIIGREQQQ